MVRKHRNQQEMMQKDWKGEKKSHQRKQKGPGKKNREMKIEIRNKKDALEMRKMRILKKKQTKINKANYKKRKEGTNKLKKKKMMMRNQK